MLDAPASGAVAQFMQYLSTNTNLFGRTDPFSSEYEITLVGHSMGTIILNEVIRRYGNLPFRNIVYMGAACTIKDFEDSVIPYLQQHRTNGVNFYNLCLHPLAERHETNGRDLIPRGSLLEWIDNFLSSPQTVPDHTLGKFENFVRAAHLIPSEVRGQVHVKAFGVAGSLFDGSPYGTKESTNLFDRTNQMPRLVSEDNFLIFPVITNPQKHGDFSLQPYWEEAFWAADRPEVVLENTKAVRKKAAQLAK